MLKSKKYTRPYDIIPAMSFESITPEKLPYGTKPYLAIFGPRDYRVMGLRDLNQSLYEKFGGRPLVTSGRLGTGIAGLTLCESGNKGPKARNETIIFIGRQGLIESVNLGFLPCPTCKPDETIFDYWSIVEPAITERFGFLNPKTYIDRSILRFDAMRVDLEKLLPFIEKLPGRLYIRPNLSEEELSKRKKRLLTMVGQKGNIPALGFFDWNAGKENGYFVPYDIESV